MKKITLIMVTLLCFSIPAFADMKDKTAFVSTLRQAAEELKQSNPSLSKKLSDFAAKKEEWKEKSKGKKRDMEKFHQKKMKDVQKIKEAAVALETTHKDLAKDLKNIANRWEKKIDKKKIRK